MIGRAVATLHRKLERSSFEDVQRLERLICANHSKMAELLANVERELGPADRVVMLKAQQEPAPELFVHPAAKVIAVLRTGNRMLEAEELSEPAPAGRFHVLAGVGAVFEVRTLRRT